MRPIIFCGPTLFEDDLLRARDIAWRPPAEMGDVYRAARERPRAIGIIDGVFEAGPSIWHKEILWALSRGIRVYGAASMGALRATELAPFGMRGTGAIYHDFRAGTLIDDDEVAVLHAPAEHDFRPLSEALVDIRATLSLAVERKVVSRITAERILGVAKVTFFKERQWQRILALAFSGARTKGDLEKFRSWLAHNRVERKREDARAMVRTIRRFVASAALPCRPRFTFRHTTYWQQLVETQAARIRRPKKASAPKTARRKRA